LLNLQDTHMKLATAVLILGLALAAIGCDDRFPHESYDTVAPLPPVGIVTVSLDNAVEIRWIANQEDDVAGYNIYVSSSYSGRYRIVGSSVQQHFLYTGARNGVTEYYAVTAYDFSGNESDLSRDVAYDTPRPEGYDLALADRFRDPKHAGYDFSAFRFSYFDSDETDVYAEFDTNGTPFLVVWKDSDIQDMGFTASLDDISVAPEAGWSPTRDAVAIVGHTYVVWTFDNHFAKVRVTAVHPDAVVFDWAYQTATGNPELLRQRREGLSKTSGRRRH
jgi:hypothetical protein